MENLPTLDTLPRCLKAGVNTQDCLNMTHLHDKCLKLTHSIFGHTKLTRASDIFFSATNISWPIVTYNFLMDSQSATLLSEFEHVRISATTANHHHLHI